MAGEQKDGYLKINIYYKVMTIDPKMLAAVSHYLGGKVALARMTHSEMKEMGRSVDHTYEADDGVHTLDSDLESARSEFLRHCGEMLKDPVPEQYVNRKKYHLCPADRNFLSRLFEQANRANWRIASEVDELCSEIDRYAPDGGFGSDV